MIRKTKLVIVRILKTQTYNIQAWSFAGNGQGGDNGGVPDNGRGEAQRLRQLPVPAVQQEPDGGVAGGQHLRPRDQGRQHRPAERGQQSLQPPPSSSFHNKPPHWD